MDQNLNIKPNTLSIIEEKVGNRFELIHTGDDFLDRKRIAQTLRSTIKSETHENENLLQDEGHHH